MAGPMNLESIDEILRKLQKARTAGVNMVVVWRPDYEDDTTQENRPDVIACNFDNPQLAAALLGHNMPSGADEDAQAEA